MNTQLAHAGQLVSPTNPLPTTLSQGGSPISTANPIPVASRAAAAGFSPLTISELTLTRPADVAPYAANDAVSNSTSAPTLLEFANVLPVAGADGVILAARCMTNQAAFAGALRLHLFRANTPTPINDNAAHTLLFANRAVRVGFIDFAGFTTGGTGSDCAITLGTFPGSGTGLPIELAAGQTSLWGMVETRGNFTPASGQQFYFSLKTLQS